MLRRIDARRAGEQQVVEEVAVAVFAGAAVIVPTDAHYALGCDPMRPDAVARLTAGTQDRPLSLMFGGAAEALEYAPGNELAGALARRLWPGPLALLVKRPRFVDPRVTAGRTTVALRVPLHPLTGAILERCGPLAALSIPAVPDGGTSGAELMVDEGSIVQAFTTVVDVSSGILRLVREGAISAGRLREIARALARPFAGALALVFCLSNLAGAAPMATSEFAGYTFHFLSAEWNEQTGNFSIPKRFRATRKERDIEGDRVNGNTIKKTFTAQGHVIVHQRAALGGSGEVAGLTRLPSTLTTDRLEADVPREKYTAIGNVHFVQLGRDAVADRGSFDSVLGRLHLEGRVRIRDGDATLLASIVDYDARTGDVSMPSRFTVERAGSTVGGDRGSGNARSQIFSADGNVIVDRAGTPPSHLTADRVQADGLQKRYVADGNVRFSQGNREATADRGTLDDLRHTLHMDGNVHVREDDRRVAAAVVDYDIASGQARASDRVVIDSPGAEFRSASAVYNTRNGEFSAESRFTAVRGGTTIEGDRAQGNATRKTFVANGNVIVHQERPLGGAGELAGLTRRPATLTSDRLEVDGKRQEYTAIGNAHFVQQATVDQLDRDAVADRMHYDERLARLHLEGNVRVRDGKSTLVAKAADYDINSGNFKTLDRFKFTRDATDVAGDKGQGNTKTLKFVVAGNVVVNQTQPLAGHGDISKMTDQPSTLTTDRLDVDGIKKFYVATGNVHFTQVEREANAAHGTLDDLSHVLHLDGKVKIRDGERRLDADTVDYNTETGAVHAVGNVTARAPGTEFIVPAASPAPAGRKSP